MSKFTAVALPILLAIFLFFNLNTLQDGHYWGDDFAQYVRHAQNIAEGKPYAEAIMLDQRWGITPPLFPALLAPLVKLFGLNLKILKIWNVFFWLGYAVVLALIARRRLPPFTSFLFFFFILTSPFLFLFKQFILTDIPFLFFFTLTILCFERSDGESGKEKSHRGFVTGIIAMTAAILTRLPGLTLAAAGIIYFLWNKRDWKRAATILITAVLAYLAMLRWGINAAAPLSAFGSQPTSIFTQAYLNCFAITEIFLKFIFPLPSALSQSILSWLAPWSSELTPIFLLLLALFTVIKLSQRRPSFLLLAGTFYLGMLAFWPAMEDRYVLPLAGPGLIAVLLILQKLDDAIKTKLSAARNLLPAIILIFLIANNIYAAGKTFGTRLDGVNQPASQALFNWIKTNTPADARLMSRYPRLLWLMTDRPSTPFYLNWDDLLRLPQRLHEYQISYIIFTKNQDLGLLKKFQTERIPCARVWENENFLIYKIAAP